MQPDPSKVIATHRYDPRAILSAPDLGVGAKHASVADVQNYLARFGYLDPTEITVPGELDKLTGSALARFQARFNLQVSAALDAGTRTAMSLCRCGMPDVIAPIDFSTIGPWNRRDLEPTRSAIRLRCPFHSSPDLRRAKRRAACVRHLGSSGCQPHVCRSCPESEPRHRNRMAAGV